MWDGFTPMVWLFVCWSVVLGLTVSVVIARFNSVVKAFSGPGIIFCVSGSSYLLFESDITQGFIVALGLYLLSVWLYAFEGKEPFSSATSTIAAKKKD